MVKIFCVNTQTSKTFPEGMTLQEMLPSFEFEKPYPILCAKVNNVSQGLKYRAFNSRQVEFLENAEEHYRKGDPVRVVQGVFKGAVGVVKRVKKDRKLLVAIDGVAVVAVPHIPLEFLERI